MYDAPDLFEPLGNVLEEPITEIWQHYRFKRNHVTKYLARASTPPSAEAAMRSITNLAWTISSWRAVAERRLPGADALRQ